MLRWLRQSLRQVSSLMARRPVLVCGAILLSVLLLLAVTFTCSRAKNVVASARPPVRFFSAEAPVVDLYLGQLEQVERLRGAAEVSVIFFYAPWCAHSIAARHEVQEVARRLVKQVQFVAVNCWWSQGKCRKQKSFYQYPVIHLFYKRFGPIEYKGPFLASYVERFILRVITPLTYLPSRATLQDFLSYHEPGVVGYFQFNSSPQPPGYITYLSSALQALKRDFRGAVRFGVVTSRQVAESISVRDDQTVYLHRHFNSSLIFPSWERNFTSEGICSWVFEHRETVLQWLAPTGAKSRLLEQELTKGPALLLFLPHNPLGPGPDPLLTQIADVAVRYHSCSDSPHHHHHHPSDHYYYSGPSQPLSPPLCCLSVVLPRPHPLPGSTSRVCELCLNQSNPGRSPLCTFPSQTSGGAAVLQSYLRQCCLPVAATGRTVACSNILSSYSPSSGRYSACCRTLGQLGVSLPPQQVLGLDNEGLGTPPPSPSYSQDSSQDDSQDSSQDSSPSSQDQEAGGIKGLRCRTNKTLRFYILDSALHWPLAVRLGALGNNEMGSGGLGELGRLLGNGTGDGAQSFATIVNLKDEVHYVLDHRGTATVTESLELFIRNFSTSHSPLQRRLVGRREEEERPQKRPLISELTTTSFLTTVMDPHRDVVLFYYSQWCGYCSVLNHVIIQLARMFRGNSTVTIARVNVARNDLPWEFMVDHFPSVLLFPRHRKHLSVKFPEDTPITLPTLLRFILKHSDSAHQPMKADGSDPHPHVLLKAEFRALQGEVQTLHRARQRLSNQLAQLWRDNRRLSFHAVALETHNALLQSQNGELQRERLSLVEQHKEKSRQLGEAVRRLQELADASENLLTENTLLRVLLGALRARETERGEEENEEEEEEETGEERSYMAS
ncbi:thioredoxin domain-containing protein 11 isoform X5 [Oncorhynchus mykiss]|uniref:thioredoxin domain-containing protein 11-like isoform X5 n=1 Tax=Oncorhynchus mykiss TaxID=8022 RepID=UPI001878C638|nr:thioredoxin domain-containing protein 11-like isoform X5 [Oncorhynchus mykiss]XP_036798064.1 thioredoxin domain-containing protein 11-like isoform X6 [Oncorhynchus mykiss]XP_036829198.1 thioredoxin domain-containing protein 11 isoform X5 [Oncorhynchus mykiss]